MKRYVFIPSDKLNEAKRLAEKLGEPQPMPAMAGPKGWLFYASPEVEEALNEI